MIVKVRVRVIVMVMFFFCFAENGVCVGGDGEFCVWMRVFEFC